MAANGPDRVGHVIRAMRKAKQCRRHDQRNAKQDLQRLIAVFQPLRLFANDRDHDEPDQCTNRGPNEQRSWQVDLDDLFQAFQREVGCESSAHDAN